MKPSSIFRRESSLKAVRNWLQTCSQPLLIIGPPYCGKTYLARQIQSSVDCVAAHFCLIESSETTESATLLRSLAGQLTKRFPNLVLPKLSTLTLLADYDNALEQYFTLPLASLPRPTKPLFILIDNILPHIYDLVLAINRCLPSWMRLAVTSRPLAPSDQYKFERFHDLVLSECIDELDRFIEVRLPQCLHCEVLDACDSSWFFVDQMARAVDAGIVPPDRVSCSVKDLMDDICLALPQRLPIYLLLIKASRQPPPLSFFYAVAQLVVRESVQMIEREIHAISIVLQSTDPLIMSGPWAEIDGDLALYHTAWAEFYKTKRRKTPQDVVELAYHLAHSTVPPLDAIRTLSSVGAGDLILKCAVIDIPTSVLLSKAGALQQEISLIDDFIYLCCTGDLEKVTKQMTCQSDPDLLLGLLAASSQGQLQICKTLLQYRPQISNHVCNGQWNALRSAACNNHLDVLNLLIDSGVNVDEVGSGERTALRGAAWAGHRDIVSRLLKAHACVDRKDSEDRTALMAAAFMDHWEIVDLLLDHGAKISETDSAGATALHLALSNGSKTEAHDKTVQTLIRRGSDLTLADAHGRVCIHLAAYHGDRNLKALIGATCIDVQDSLGRTPLMLAASQGQLEAVDLLTKSGAYIDCIDSDGRTAFQLAAIHGHLPVVDMLLGLGADEAHKDNDGAVALHYAVAHGDVTLCRALATKATVRATDRAGNSPLINACQGDNEEVVEELINLGANVEQLSLNGQSALRVAALSGNTKIVRLLAEHITDWEQQDMDGTPLVHTLLINKQTAMAELLLTLGAFISARDAHGRTCAHVVCAINDMCGARMLRRLAASFEAVDAGGRTPLLTAVWNCHLEMTAYLLETVGVNPNAVDEQGASALSVAAQQGNRELVVLLLRMGAEPSLKDLAGRTALDVATMYGHDTIRAVLQSASGSADSSGFGSVPNSPLDFRSLGRKSLRKSQKMAVTSPRLLKKPV
uniref:ANK_REP_REGION domain-containing protein n=2 Tax=Haemonchus contortus TaxID=6289 RepID=A0A7I4YCQ5_HAECO